MSDAQPLVAVLGGGQLGRMLALAGLPLGLRFRFLDPEPDAPARALGALVVGDLADEAALAEVAAGASAVTYEWEGVPADAVRFLSERVCTRPGSRSLEVAQDRLLEKQTFQRLGVPGPAFAPADSRESLRRAVETIGLPAVVKTRRGGYDGKGQRVVSAPAEIDDAWRALGPAPLLVEARVPFDRELSTIAVRAADGTTACWPMVENHHRDGILRTSRAPAPGLTPALEAHGERVAHVLLDALDHVGVLAIELFQVGDDLLPNELAPRVHNSGHWTIEGADTSQFENHLRAVMGWPLGSTAARAHSEMVNCIGALPDPETVLRVPGAHLHDYGKTPRAGRKLGHVTVTAASPEELDERAARLRTALALTPA
jgi:5-(carboxyamino)imidazole ribonucleotide synthase